MYCKYGKRLFDIVMSGILLILLSPLIALLALKVKKEMGTPIIFCQKRPGKNEAIFRMYKFRTMTDNMDKKGKQLPDEKRLTPFGKKLRETSLDELPELWNILKGDMSFVGPRPQLMKDMVFMSKEQRLRHKVSPGLTGLAQVNGRNTIKWEEKLDYDLIYCRHITFFGDLKILIQTIWEVLSKNGISQEGMDTAEDFGDYLLSSGIITESEYIKKMEYCATKEWV